LKKCTDICGTLKAALTDEALCSYALNLHTAVRRMDKLTHRPKRLRKALIAMSSILR